MDELKGTLESLTKCTLTNEALAAILETMRNSHEVSFLASGKIQVENMQEIPSLASALKQPWEEFELYVLKFYPDYDIGLHRPKASKFFNRAILRLTSKLQASNFSLQRQVDVFDARTFESEMEEISTAEFGNNHLAQQFVKLLNDYLQAQPKMFSDFAYKSYMGLVNIDLVFREQDFSNFDFGGISCFLADTSFLASLLCPTSARHLLAVAVANKCVSHKIPILFTEWTRQEMASLVVGSIHEMQSSIPEKQHNLSGNQFVRDYARQLADRKTTWGVYRTDLESWPKRLHEYWNIDEAPHLDIDQTVCEDIRKLLPIEDLDRQDERRRRGDAQTPRLRSPNQIDHDAYCLAAIQKRRDSMQSEPDAGPWFLTFDNLLCHVDLLRNKMDIEACLCMPPRKFLNYILTYSHVAFSPEDRKEVAAAILAYATNLEDTVVLSFEQYTQFTAVRLGLEEKDAQFIRQIILKAPLKDELQRALREGDYGKTDSLAARILAEPELLEHFKTDKSRLAQLTKVQELLRKEQEARRMVEVQLEEHRRPQKIAVSIAVDVSVEIDIKLKSQIEAIAGILHASGAPLPAPGTLDTKAKVQEWLTKVNSFINGTSATAQSLAYLQPIVKAALSSIGVL